jgi:hypothetical protein
VSTNKQKLTATPQHSANKSHSVLRALAFDIPTGISVEMLAQHAVLVARGVVAGLL